MEEWLTYLQGPLVATIHCRMGEYVWEIRPIVSPFFEPPHASGVAGSAEKARSAALEVLETLLAEQPAPKVSGVLLSEGFEHTAWTHKADAGKLPWHLVPLAALEEVVRIYEFGLRKYGLNTWQLVENPQDRYWSAIVRHLVAWKQGEQRDSESGLHHLAHAAWGCLALMWFDRNGGGK